MTIGKGGVCIKIVGGLYKNRFRNSKSGKSFRFIQTLSNIKQGLFKIKQTLFKKIPVNTVYTDLCILLNRGLFIIEQGSV